MNYAEFRQKHIIVLGVVSQYLLLICSNKRNDLLLVRNVDCFLYFYSQHYQILICIRDNPFRGVPID